MRLTQGAFSFLPDLSDEQIAKQVKYCLDNGWAVNVEYTDDPHPRLDRGEADKLGVELIEHLLHVRRVIGALEIDAVLVGDKGRNVVGVAAHLRARLNRSVGRRVCAPRTP